MSMAKDTACSSCHGEIGPDINGCIMCYGCGPAELVPPGRGPLAKQQSAAVPAVAAKAVAAPAPAPLKPPQRT